jgi:hypothetical protein
VTAEAVSQGKAGTVLFQGAKIVGSSPTELPLATRKGNRIPNEVIPDPDDAERHKADLFVKLFGKHWEPRKPHLGVYNCAGHVWASRRTAILDEEAVRLILVDDSYRRVGNDELVLPGDLALYWHVPTGAKGTWLHVGMVCDIRILGKTRIPWVLSKWGTTTGEWLHRFDDVPYDKQGFTQQIEFWTDRP